MKNASHARLKRFQDTIVALVCSIAALIGTETANAAEGEFRPTVVELFTSQGCSSCPPADAYLAELAQRNDILAITLPVTYWDYLGWNDTLARREYDLRQRAYAERYGSGRVYTPQMVVDGLHREIGSHRQTVEAVIAYQAASRKPIVPIDLTVKDDALLIDVGGAELAKAETTATVWLVGFERTVSVPIRGGENNRRTVTYTNVVRQMSPIGMWNGQKLHIRLPRQEIAEDDKSGCAILLQMDGTGEIVGAGEFRASRLVK